MKGNVLMKRKILFLAILVALFSDLSYAQFDKFVLQFNAGVTNPDMSLRGNNFVRYENNFRYQRPGDTSWYSISAPTGFAYVHKDLFTKNMGAKTGFNFGGLAKINIDKYETVRLIGSLGFSTFNSFETSKSGSIPYFYYDINGVYQAGAKPISYDYTLNNFGLGLGVEVAPLSFTKLISPFVNAQFGFNFINAKLTRTLAPNDTTGFSIADFRMGITLGAGIEFKINPQWGFLVGAKYDMANLLLKNNERSGFNEWGSENASLNDEEGLITSNLYAPLGSAYEVLQSQKKELNWATFYIGINFYPNITGTGTKKK